MLDFLMLNKIKWLHNSINSERNIKLAINNLKHIEWRFKNLCLKTIILETKLEMHKKTWGYQLHSLENSTTNLKYPAMKFKLFKGDSKMLVKSEKDSLNTKAKCQYFHHKYRDWMALLKKRTHKSEHWTNRLLRWRTFRGKSRI